MSAEPEFLVHCTSGEEVGRALARGLAVIATPAAAEECGAEPGDPAELEAVIESHLRPYGDADGRDAD